MNPLSFTQITCPYCNALNELSLDCSDLTQQYTEDCRACCKPIVVQLEENAGEYEVQVSREQD